MLEPKDMRFQLLASGLALTVLFNFGAYSVAETPLVILATCLSAIALVFPTPATLGAMYLAYCVHYLVDPRDYRVHTHFQFVIALSVLLSLALAAVGPREGLRARFVELFAPIGVGIAGISFFAAGLAKVNRDFLVVHRSCATIFYEWSRTVFPYSLLPTGRPVILGVVGVTWVCELLGPLLIPHQKTRRVGFLLIFLLAFLLGTNPQACYYEFTSPFLALLLFGFAPEESLARLKQRTQGYALPSSSRLSWFALALLGLLLLAAMLSEGNKAAETVRLAFTRGLFVVWALLYVLPVALTAPTVRLLERSRPLHHHLAWVAILFVLVQESTSFLGIRAQGAFAMAGNFNTTVLHSTHLLIREVPQLPFNHMAVLQRSSSRELDRRGTKAWPTWMLFDYLARHPRHWAVVTIDGVEERFEARSDDPRIRKSLFAVLFPAMQVTTSERVQCAHDLPDSSPYRR